MSTTTNHATILEERPTEHTPAEHQTQSVIASTQRSQHRTTIRWFSGGIVAIAATALISMLVTSTDTDTSVDHVRLAEGGDATELDVHGIPIEWSRNGGTPRRDDVTELDVHGIPTWWSGNAPAP